MIMAVSTLASITRNSVVNRSTFLSFKHLVQSVNEIRSTLYKYTFPNLICFNRAWINYKFDYEQYFKN